MVKKILVALIASYSLIKALTFASHHSIQMVAGHSTALCSSGKQPDMFFTPTRADFMNIHSQKKMVLLFVSTEIKDDYNGNTGN